MMPVYLHCIVHTNLVEHEDDNHDDIIVEGELPTLPKLSSPPHNGRKQQTNEHPRDVCLHIHIQWPGTSREPAKGEREGGEGGGWGEGKGGGKGTETTLEMWFSV